MNKYQCAFCGKTIDEKNERVTSLLITSNWGNEKAEESQQMFCHLQCFKHCLNDSSFLYIEDEPI